MKPSQTRLRTPNLRGRYAQQLEWRCAVAPKQGVKLDEPLPDLSWIYLPFEEQGPTNRVTYYSNYSKFNAPAGHGCFLAEVTHRGELRADDREWLQGVVDGLDRAGILRKEQVVLLEACNNEFAYIDQDLEFAARVERVRKWFDNSGYLTFGRFGRYEYHNSDQCVKRAMQVHQHIRSMAEGGDRPALELA